MTLIHPARSRGKKIVAIVGAGFGGLNAAKKLANQEGISVVLIDQRNNHLFQPLLYQVATAGLNPADIAVPIRAQFTEATNVEVYWQRLQKVDLVNKQIFVENVDEGLEFDYLILACGAQHSYFGHPEWEDFAPGLKTLEQATEIRRRMLSAFERAESEFDPEKQKSLMTFVIVGGGPTGVELAGAIAEISRTILVHDFRRIDPSKAKVILIEGGPRLVSSFDEALSERTKKDLEDLGVEVRLKSIVDRITSEGVAIGAEFIPCQTITWAAGVQAAKVAIEPSPEMDRSGRIKVNADLSLPQFDHVFVIGDMALVEMETGKYVPGLAPAAIQQGQHTAKNILRTIRGEQRLPFHYRDKGQMATIGKNKAILQVGKFKMTGRLAWFAWLFIHIFYLVGFKNRVGVFLQWAWSYLFSKRGSRLITDRQWKLKT